MAADINNITIVGRLTRDCEVRSIPNTTVCNISLAVNRRAKSQDGTWNDEVSYFDVTLFGRLGEALQQYLTKGTQIAVDGELRQNRWEQEGQKRSRVIIIANNVQLLGSRNGNTGVPTGTATTMGGGGYTPNQQQGYSDSGGDNFEDDIPF